MKFNQERILPYALGALIGLVFGYIAPHTEDNLAVGTSEQTIEELKEAKVQILSEYVYAAARLDEIPTLDLTNATPEEMSQAFVDAIEDKEIEDPDQNLFQSLRQEAIARAEACVKP